MRYLRYLLLAATLGVSLTGCGPRNDVVGKWAGSLQDPQGGSVAINAEFKADGTDTQTVQGGGKTIVMQAKYEIKDGKMTQTPVSATIDGKPLPMPSTASETFSYKVEGDTMTITRADGKVPLSLKRVPN